MVYFGGIIFAAIAVVCIVVGVLVVRGRGDFAPMTDDELDAEALEEAEAALEADRGGAGGRA